MRKNIIMWNVILVLLVVICSTGLYINNIQSNKNPIHSIEKIPYYIEFNFKDNKKVITFENILLKDIHVYKGEINILVDRRVYPEEFTIDVIDLKGDYDFQYKDIHLISNNKNIMINDKIMTPNKVIIDNNSNLKWNAWVNYWEIPVNKVDEYNKNGKLTYKTSPGIYYTN